MSEKYDIEEVSDSLTRWDEIAIDKAFGAEFGQLISANIMTACRSLYFVLKRRDGMKDNEAKTAAFDLTLKQVHEIFIAEDELPDLDPDNPDSESGKDDAPVS